MPPARPLRRRTTSGARPRLAAATVAAAIVMATSACSGGEDTPRGVVDAGPSTRADAPTEPTQPTQPAAAAPSPALTFSTPTGGSAVLDYPSLLAAVATVPANSAIVTFTDVKAVKKRLGYADVTSESPARERFDFWERARADGAMFTGARLYDVSSVMSLDYGWTGEDVDWEADFAAPENGCQRAMLCDTAHGFVLGLRRDLDWSVVTGSLADKGFVQDGADPDTFRTEDAQAPFDVIRLIPELNAVAGGNEIGVQRIADVVDGAPSFGPRIGDIYDRLGAVESMRVTTRCVDLDDALGPDATNDDVTAFLSTNTISNLAPATSVAVVLADRRSAQIEVGMGAGATGDDLSARLAAIRSWPGLQTGIPFEDVATLDGTLNPPQESFTLDVARASAFRAMVLNDDAPWALCPYVEQR